MAVGTVVAIVGLVKSAYDAYKAIEEANETYQTVMQVYKTYAEAKAFLATMAPSPEVATVLSLQALHQGFTEMSDQLDELRDAIKQLLNHEEQAALLALQRDLDQFMGHSRTAQDHLSRWIEGGYSEDSYRLQAEASSWLAVNTLLVGDSFFHRPNTHGGPIKFDHRLAATTYTHVLTARVGVMAVLNPNFRTSAAARAELQRHADRLSWIIEKADAALVPEVSEGSLDAGHFRVRYRSLDTISGYDSGWTDSGWIPGGQTDLNNYRQSLLIDLKAGLRLRTGLHLLMRFRDEVQYHARDPRTTLWKPWGPILRIADGNPTVGDVTPVVTGPGAITLLWKNARFASGTSAHLTSRVPKEAVPVWTPVKKVGPDGSESTPKAAVTAPGRVTAVFTHTEFPAHPRVTAVDFDPPLPDAGNPAIVTIPTPTPAGVTRTVIDVIATSPTMVDVFWHGGFPEIYGSRRDETGQWSDPKIVVTDSRDFLQFQGTSDKDGKVATFWSNQDGALRSAFYDRYDNPPLTSATTIASAGTVRGRLLATSPRKRCFEVFWLGVDEAVWYSAYVGDGPEPRWSDPSRLTERGAVPHRPLAATSPTPGTVMVFSQAADGRLYAARAGKDAPGDGTSYTLGTAVWPQSAFPWSGSGPKLACASTTPDDVTVFYPWHDVIEATTCDLSSGAPTRWLRVAQDILASADRLWNEPVGASETAIERALDAVAITRVLAIEDPRTYGSSHANWLVHPVSTYLAAQGRHNQAIEGVDEAVKVYRDLVATHPDNPAYLKNLAWALHNLTARHNQAGQPQSAAGLGTEGAQLPARFDTAGASPADRADIAWNIVYIGAYLPAGAE
ncbi:hypothetical protein BIU82_18460, partial [Arthrobacter sp. SW1]|uniref:hypothetical protein n=1 Tax=Arthrobacter sp. SW1 TaxID=1920889 RepID=UPI000877C423